MRKVVTDQLIEIWNATYPLGTEVAVVLDNGEVLQQTKTRTPAYARQIPDPILDESEPVVAVDGLGGSFELSRVMPLRR